MRIERRWSAALALIALTLLPGSAGGDSPPLSCRYAEAGPPGPAGNRLVVDAGSDYLTVRRDGDVIGVNGRGRCKGEQATIRNIDRIVVQWQGLPVFIDERGGRFGPGATPEARGSEIEVILYADRIQLDATTGRDRIRAKAHANGQVGVDLDAPAEGQYGDEDLKLMAPDLKFVKLRGHAGEDMLDVRGWSPRNGDGPRLGLSLFGEGGDDTILGSPGGEQLLSDGRGDDLVRAGGGNDRVTISGGRDVFHGGHGDDELINLSIARQGTDRLFGGPGSDRLADIDGEADEFRCGRGADVAEPDEKDRVGSDCERTR